MEVSGHQHLEGDGERPPEVIEHLSPRDPQLPLIPLAETRITSYEYRGPIPDPAMLARYNEVDPTFADRIMKMAEAEVYARTESMKDLSSAEANAVRWGAMTMVAVVLLGLLSAVVLMVLGYPGIALLLAVPALLTGLARVIEAVRSGRVSDTPANDNETNGDPAAER